MNAEFDLELIQDFEDGLIEETEIEKAIREQYKAGNDQIAEWLCELNCIKRGFKTKDGIPVSAGDTVWVQGSTSVESATVKELKQVTSYELFGPIPVDESFSTRESAEKWRYGKGIK
jgi:hypothetical protein